MQIKFENGGEKLRYIVLSDGEKEVRERISLDVYNMPNGSKRNWHMTQYLKKVMMKAKKAGLK